MVRQLLPAPRVHAGPVAVHRAGLLDGPGLHRDRDGGVHRASARALSRARSPERLRDLAAPAAPDPHRGGAAPVLHAPEDAGLLRGAPHRARRGDHPLRDPQRHRHAHPLRPGPRGGGAEPGRAFLEVTLGVIKPGVVAGAIFAFAISFDNFTLSLFLTSSKLTPLPIELFACLKYASDPTPAAVPAFAIGVALVLVLGIARFMGLEEFTGF